MNRAKPKIEFTPEQIQSELQQQGITSIMGEKGCFILYRYLQKHYGSIENFKIDRHTFRDCGIDISSYKRNQLFIGEFVLTKSYAAFNTAFTVSLNKTISTLKE